MIREHKNRIRLRLELRAEPDLYLFLRFNKISSTTNQTRVTNSPREWSAQTAPTGLGSPDGASIVPKAHIEYEGHIDTSLRGGQHPQELSFAFKPLAKSKKIS